ncbi:HEXXH motif domain-containing protein [Actinomadura sp. WMMB 499]|uniref:HEXXH motif domain-containing protein n=1 Tax=Actinomadura sp. WMMB 499 TaxID=1219491 RepID=UPI001248BC3E|nr:HEXXH motif domain-containing protein [Actinomadura sp. WMMB 499]QFG24992.1 HEXXH motif domain-containing protein [Actinomadura sp. WMMB 499]
MILTRHEVPEKIFQALAAGEGGAEAVELLNRAQYSKRLLLLRGIRDAGGPRARHAYDLLARIQDENPRAVETVLRYPTVGEWARRTLLVLTGREPGAANPDEFAGLAAAAAIRAGHPCAIEVPARDGAITLPSLGRTPIPESALVRVTPEGTTIGTGSDALRLPPDPHKDAPGWQAVRSLPGGLLLDDHDPDRMPGGTALPRRLTGPELAHWEATLTEARRILARHHRIAAAETTAAITVLTPLVAPEHGQSSATPKHAFGNVGLSTPPDALFLAVTFAHEVQHTKLTGLLELVPLTRPDDGTRYYAPWRTDPRPVPGLLQGVYAHLGIAAFWRVQRHHETGESALRAHADFARWRTATDLILRTLAATGDLTPDGERFVTGMAHTLRPWLDEPVPPDALALSLDAAAHHLATWRAAHGDPPPLQGL